MLILGDSLDKLKELDDNSIDSIVSDPPYGLSFMGKKWDYDVPSVELWQEVLRVLKPGGHALIACGTRTQHRMAVNLEDAGFEIRDIVAWVYGSGFPKSLSIGKAVDKIQGNEREIIDEGKATGKDGSFNAMNPSKKGFNSGEFKWGFKDKGTSPYEGYGTALKPAMELWTLCRKPFKGTVASNVLEWGCGGLNIDGSRISTTEKWEGREMPNAKDGVTWGGDLNSSSSSSHELGRFPANLIHDGSDEVVGLFPNSKSGDGKANTYEKDGGHWGQGKQIRNADFGDSGSAARFFYCAKASKSERNKGLEGFEEKQMNVTDNNARTWNDRCKTCSKKFVGSDDTICHCPSELKITDKTVYTQQNFHPTVKPVSLMRYLCKLITPKGGTILDPFMGSGTTGIGAKLEGFDFIGIEREEDYLKIAEARIEAWKPDKQEVLF